MTVLSGECTYHTWKSEGGLYVNVKLHFWLISWSSISSILKDPCVAHSSNLVSHSPDLTESNNIRLLIEIKHEVPILIESSKAIFHGILHGFFKGRSVLR